MLENRSFVIPLLLIFLNTLYKTDSKLHSFVEATSSNFIKLNNFNCSTYKPPPNYNSFKFTGIWNYVGLFSPPSLNFSPECIRLKANVILNNILLNVRTMLKNGEKYELPISGISDENEESDWKAIEGIWNLYANISSSLSKWIILSEEENLSLYLICTDFPGQISAVSEIGLLSRSSDIRNLNLDPLFKIIEDYGFDISQFHKIPTSCNF